MCMFRFPLSITAAAARRTVRAISAEVLLSGEEGMAVKRAVNPDELITIDKKLLQERIAHLSSAIMTAVAPAGMIIVEPSSMGICKTDSDNCFHLYGYAVY